MMTSEKQLDAIRLAGDREGWSVRLGGTRLVFGDGVLGTLGEHVVERGMTRPLLVTDPGVGRAGHTGRALAALEPHVEAITVFGEVKPNPTSRDVDRGAEVASAARVDGIIALGGGSVLDCAKGINFVSTGGGRMADYLGYGKATSPMLPSIGIPGTAGTGSDAQSYALISDPDTGAKMACGDPKAMFGVVLLDPALTATLPRDVAGASGVDAMSHAVESYVTRTGNPISRLYAAEAWRLIDLSLQTVLENPEDGTARGRMLLASHLAGAAIECSMLGAAHACANPLTARFGVRHGVAVGLMLPHVVRFNSLEVSHLYEELHRNTASDAAGWSLEQRIAELLATAGVPTRLEDCDVKRDALEQLAEDAAEQWTAGHNPRPVNSRDLFELYESAF
jgi:alcohol dehydrogenase